MAHFCGTLCGSRGPASRLGTKHSGLNVEACGWDVGGSVSMEHHEPRARPAYDAVHIRVTAGSASHQKSIPLGAFTAGDLDVLLMMDAQKVLRDAIEARRIELQQTTAPAAE